MKIICETSLYVKVCDDFLEQDLTKKTIKEYLEVDKLKLSQARQTLPEFITQIILFKMKNMKNLKSFWYELKNASHNAWPNLPSYSRFNIWVRRLGKFLTFLIKKNLSNLNQNLGFIDSTKIKVSELCYRGKSIKESTKGYSSTGEFFGFKLHVLISHKKEIINYSITPAKTHDLTPIKSGFLDGQTGKIFADSGYVSREIYYKLMEQNLTLIAKPKAVMMENNMLGLGYLPDWNIYKNQYKKRQNIESFFNVLKNNLGMVLNKVKTFNSLNVNILASILTYQLINKQQISFKTI